MSVSNLFSKGLANIFNTVDQDWSSDVHKVALIGATELVEADLDAGAGGYDTAASLTAGGKEFNTSGGYTAGGEDIASTLTTGTGVITAADHATEDTFDFKLNVGSTLTYSGLTGLPTGEETLSGCVLINKTSDNCIAWIRFNTPTVTNGNDYVISFSGGILFDFAHSYAA